MAPQRRTGTGRNSTVEFTTIDSLLYVIVSSFTNTASSGRLVVGQHYHPCWQQTTGQYLLMDADDC